MGLKNVSLTDYKLAQDRLQVECEATEYTFSILVATRHSLKKFHLICGTEGLTQASCGNVSSINSVWPYTYTPQKPRNCQLNKAQDQD